MRRIIDVITTILYFVLCFVQLWAFWPFGHVRSIIAFVVVLAFGIVNRVLWRGMESEIMYQ